MRDPLLNTFEKVRRFIERCSMLENAEGLVIAFSGGPDSRALVDILVRLRESLQTGSPFRLHIAHLDHQLRGDESTADAEFVARVAADYSLPVTIERADTRTEARRSRRGIEDTARRLRYEFLARVATQQRLELVATGHTMNDQAETLLLRLIRGAGVRGLAAMRPSAPLPSTVLPQGSTAHRNTAEPRLRVVRPLLCLERKEIEAYCRAASLEFRTDSSNASIEHSRNRVRLELLPLLEQMNPKAVRSVARAAASLSQQHEFLEEYADAVLEQAAVSSQRCRSDENRYTIETFVRQPRAIRNVMILRAVSRASIYVRNDSVQITSKHIEAVDGLLTSGVSGKHLELPGGVEVWCERDVLLIKADSQGPVSSGNSGTAVLELGAAGSVAEFFGWRISAASGLAAGSFEGLLEAARNLAESAGRDWMMALLSEVELPRRLLIRTRRPGERVLALGRAKTKKLKKLMIDHKIPSSRRSGWPVVTTPDDRYVWSPGLPPSAEFAARKDCPSLVVLQASSA